MLKREYRNLSLRQMSNRDLEGGVISQADSSVWFYAFQEIGHAINPSRKGSTCWKEQRETKIPGPQIGG